MDFSLLQIVLIGVVGFIAGIDQFSFLESLYQPIVTGAIVGAILGDVETGLVIGGTYQLMTVGNMPVGGAQPPNAIIGGIMATVFGVSSTTGLTPEAAVGLAVPFALFGQYAITFIFTICSPLMKRSDAAAEKADPAGIARINYLGMALIGGFFAIICMLGVVGGSQLGNQLDAWSQDLAWVMAGLGAAGSMMKYVGFAILLRIMLSKDLWGIFFAGFAIATVIKYIPEISGAGLLLMSFIGIAMAIQTYLSSVELKNLSPVVVDGGEEDGI